MSKKGPDAPTPPDPVKTAQAQSQYNADTARLDATLNRYNSYGPDGSTQWTHNGDQWTQTTSLSPAQQAIYDQQKAAEAAAMGVANQQIGRVGAALNTPFSYDGLPAMQYGAQGGQIQTGLGQTPGLQYGFEPGQAVQGHVGPNDFTADRNAVTDAVFNQARSRLDPQWNQREDQLDARLAAQGLSANSAAAQNARSDFGRDRNDAYNQALYSAVGQGASEQNQLFGQNLAQGQFANQAAGQMYAQNQGAAAFHNTASDSDFNRALQGGTFANTAQQQAYQQSLANANLNNSAREAAGQERAYAQNLPINQFTSLLGAGQVGMPQGNFTPVQVANTDYMGAVALNQQAQQANYQARMQQQNGLMGGLMSLGSAAIMASDVRLKTDVVRLGEAGGLGVYAFRYRGCPRVYVGHMAHEVAAVRPDAVHDMGGYLAVDYGALAA